MPTPVLAPHSPPAGRRRAMAASRHGPVLGLAMLLAACATPPSPSSTLPSAPAVRPPVTVRPGPASGSERDGAGTPPPNLAAVPDAVPVIEPIRTGGPNKPYEAMGEVIRPLPAPSGLKQSGLASWYGSKFHGRRTANGEVYDMYGMSAAHRTLPLPSYLRVRNPANGKEVVVRVNDRGPFHSQRILDLSYAAAYKLDLLRGVGQVEIERITPEDIRTGVWQRPADNTARAETGAALRAAPATDAPPQLPPAAVTAGPAAAAVPVPASGAAEGAVAGGASPAGYWLQLAAFRQVAGAQGFHQQVLSRVDGLAGVLTVWADDKGMQRVQAGPYPTRAEAQSVAERLRDALKLVPLVVQRR